jgi:phage-related baseplate assembly protein
MSATAIDLSRLTAPAAIEPLDFELMLGAFKIRFQEYWDAARVTDPTLPDYNVSVLETSPAVILGQAWSYIRLLDRARVNDAVRAVLAPLAKGADLDNVVAVNGTYRLEVSPANPETGAPAIMESDERLLLRFLLGWDRPAAGSAGGYLYDTFTALPIAHDAVVNGFSVHGRRGDVDVVAIGPGGRLLTDPELTTIRTAVLHPNRKPEAVAVVVMNATRRVWNASLKLEVSRGPDPALVQAEADARIRAVAFDRMLIGGELPAEAIIGAAYGPNVLRVIEVEQVVDFTPEPYGVPVLGTLTLTTEVR